MSSLFKIELDNAAKNETKSLITIIEEAPIPRQNQTGYSIKDVRTALAIIEKLKTAEEQSPDTSIVLLEQREHDWLKDRLAKVEWRIAAPSVIELVEKIDRAEKVAVQEAKPKAAPDDEADAA